MQILLDRAHKKGVCLLSVVAHRSHITGDQLTELPCWPNIVLIMADSGRKEIIQLKGSQRKRAQTLA